MAAVGPIGNTIHVNQQMATVASDKNAQLNRLDLQNVAAAAAANDKNKEIMEVRPTEETHEVDPDREHTKKEAEQETSENEEPSREEEEQQSLTGNSSRHILDIKV